MDELFGQPDEPTGLPFENISQNQEFQLQPQLTDCNYDQEALNLIPESFPEILSSNGLLPRYIADSLKQGHGTSPIPNDSNFDSGVSTSSIASYHESLSMRARKRVVETQACLSHSKPAVKSTSKSLIEHVEYVLSGADRDANADISLSLPLSPKHEFNFRAGQTYDAEIECIWLARREPAPRRATTPSGICYGYTVRLTRAAAQVSPLTLAARNVRSLLDNPRSNRPERRTTLVARELARYKVDITVLSENRFSELEEVVAIYTFFLRHRGTTDMIFAARQLQEN
ncbi:unnamed protein product [Schistocephalus solidus]|uniref:NDT80 domain-containing protein n=1 Tax=Schistocephalus solidus TaxID=70667 RepID=A0A183T2P5_SCHSO|nr:unnamed protein product [Schistocephalus solidus]